MHFALVLLYHFLPLRSISIRYSLSIFCFLFILNTPNLCNKETQGRELAHPSQLIFHLFHWSMDYVALLSKLPNNYQVDAFDQPRGLSNPSFFSFTEQNTLLLVLWPLNQTLKRLELIFCDVNVSFCDYFSSRWYFHMCWQILKLINLDL